MTVQAHEGVAWRAAATARPVASTLGLARRSATRVAVGAAALIGLAFAARSLAYGLLLRTPVPYMDQWEFVENLMRYRAGTYGFLDLFEQHNEHRIFTARLHFWLDARVFHLGNLSVVVANYLLLAVLAALLALLSTKGRGLRAKAVAFSLALPGLWSLAGWVNLCWAFQIQWAYVHLMPALAIACFSLAARAPGPRGWLWLAAACLADGLGIVSMASGLVTIGPIVAVAVWLRARPSRLAVLALFHVAAAGLYLHDLGLPPQEMVLDPAQIARYMAPYLGTAFPISKRVEITLGAFGLVLGFGAMLAATVVALRRRPLGRANAALLGIVAFVLAEGFLTAVGRAGLPGAGGPTGLALRYGTPSQIFWTAMALLAWRLIDRRRLRPAVTAAAALAAAAAVAASNLAGHKADDWRGWVAAVNNSGYNLVNGVATGPSVAATYPDTTRIADRVAFLREHQLGPFAESEGAFRAPLNSLGAVAPGALPACAGSVDLYRRHPGSQIHVAGWAVTPGVARSASDIIAYEGDGRVLGSAKPYQGRRDPSRVSGLADVAGYDFWFALPEGESAQPVTLVAVFPPGTVGPCRVALPARPEVADAAG